MAKVQTRKSLSISGETYDKLQKFAKATERTGSGVVEGVLKALLSRPTELLESLLVGGDLVEVHTVVTPRFPLPSAERTAQEIDVLAERATRNVSRAEKLYGGEKVPELDPDTKAHRAAASIFTF
jgi:hypothetical protein